MCQRGLQHARTHTRTSFGIAAWPQVPAVPDVAAAAFPPGSRSPLVLPRGAASSGPTEQRVRSRRGI